MQEKKWQWYALNCVSNNEKKFKETLSNKINSENLNDWIDRIEIPIQRQYVYLKGKKTIRERVTMPGYVLFHADISNGELLQHIRLCKGFIGFLNPSTGGLTKQGKPEKLKESDVAMFLDINEKNLSPKWKYQIGDVVKIIDGAFASFEAIVEDIDTDKKILSVCFKIFGRENKISLDFKQVEKVDK